MQAFLFDSLGKQELPYFYLGKLDATTSEQNEYLVAKKFRLVIYPNYIQPESLGGQDFILDFKKIRPACPKTMEYLVTVRANPTILGPGKFDDEFPAIRFLNPRLDFPEQIKIKTSYQPRIVGAISVPRMQAKQTPKISDELLTLFANKSDSVAITLTNIGDRPIELGNWQAADHKQNAEIIILKNSCENRRIDPNTDCNLTIKKATDNPLSGSLYSWSTEGVSGKYFVPIIFDVEKMNATYITTGIRHH